VILSDVKPNYRTVASAFFPPTITVKPEMRISDEYLCSAWAHSLKKPIFRSGVYLSDGHGITELIPGFQ
jgi:hypothetical protein